MQIWYMNGAGNDFMVMDARGIELNFSELALKLCKKYGTDGFMAVGTSEIADFKLHFYNADGTRGEMCGNGARCICKFAYDNRIAGKEMAVETDAGLVYGERLSENQYRVRLNNPGLLDLHRKENAAYVELGNPGVPHAVVEMPDLDFDQKEELRELAKSLRYDPAFPKGANVNFYRFDGSEEILILTYERGVEDYTLACGTGSASTAVVLWAAGKLKSNHVSVINTGGTLNITIEEEDGKLTAIYLAGPAEVVDVVEEEV